MTRYNQIIRTTALLAFMFSSAVSSMAKQTVTFKGTKIEGIPHVTQKPDFCGEACTEMYLKKLGHAITQDDVFNVSGLDPLKARGCYAVELSKALKNIGFKTGEGWTKVKAGSDKEIRAAWAKVLADLRSGIPSIVCMRTGTTRSDTEHFRLVVGFDERSDEIIYHEPSEDHGGYRQMKLKEFIKCWPLKYSSKRWTVIRFRLEPGTIMKVKPAKGFTDADYAQHMMKLKKKIPGQGFTVFIQKPFVVIGDEAPAIVRHRADKTIRWAVDRLKNMYFEKNPEDIIDVWLFKNNRSYRKHTKEIFNDEPDTPYGYSSSHHKALIMNIATGGGTLVHEIVHPFMDANFSDSPSWLNEGMGSLYEQSQGKGNDIIGLTNWRLAGLQRAIKGRNVPSFEALTSTTQYEFYNEDRGTNYSQARYLCYYLQEKGLLTKFYHQFHKDHALDPTGYNTLKGVLKVKDMDKFKKDWEKFVMKLKFP